MKMTTTFRLALIPAFVAATLAGCSGSGTTEDTTSTAPPITAENLKEKTAAVNAGAGATGKLKSPGITPPK